MYSHDKNNMQEGRSKSTAKNVKTQQKSNHDHRHPCRNASDKYVSMLKETIFRKYGASPQVDLALLRLNPSLSDLLMTTLSKEVIRTISLVTMNRQGRNIVSEICLNNHAVNFDRHRRGGAPEWKLEI